MKKKLLIPMFLLSATACGPVPLEGAPSLDDVEAVESGLAVAIRRGVGSSVVADTTLTENAPTTAGGASTTLSIDRDSPTGSTKSTNTLIRFDVSSIPAGSTVQSVVLSLNVTNSTSGRGFAVYAANRAWNEAASTWQLASSGAAWQSAGARGALDRGTAALGMLLPTAPGAYSLTLNAEGVKAVKAWVDSPASNFGFVVDSPDNSDGLQFASSESATIANRPGLTVNYVPANTVKGLNAEYFADASFTNRVLQRVDATVNFNWASGSPGAGVPVDNFSVRWTGKVIPRYTQTYTFATVSDDGVRLKVNGQQIIDNWTDHAATQNTGTIALTAGQAYDLVLEFYERGGQATSTLSWSSPSQAKEIVPQAQLLASGTVTPPPPPPPPTNDGVFSMVIMPDVQREMWNAAGQTNWFNRLQWIIDRKTSENIKFVLQVGDLVDTDSCGGGDVVNGMCSQSLRDFGTYWPQPGQPTHYQYMNADRGVQMLDAAKIPYAFALGNHDAAIVCGGPTCYNHPEWGVPTSAQRNLLRTTNAWNAYFPASRFAARQGTFEPNKSDNMFHKFSAGGVNWMVINLEFYARVEVVNWARSVVAANPTHNVIVITHSYLTSGSTVGTSPEYGNTAPTYLRDNLITAFPNVKFTFSGHTGTSGHRTDAGAGGNTVHSFLDCYHDTTNNMLRMLKVDVANNKITTYVYSPKTNYYAVASQTYSVQFVR